MIVEKIFKIRFKGKVTMQNEIEEQINETKDRVVKLTGNLAWTVEKSNTFTVGRMCIKGIVTVMRSDIIIDGSNAKIDVHINDCTTSDWSLFFVHPMAKNVQFRNMRIRVYIQNPEHSIRTFAVLYNASYGLKIDNCDIEIISSKQLNIAGIYNNGNLDTHMDTRADNLTVTNSMIRAECCPEEIEKECSVYGIYNYLANSISVQNTFVYATNIGNGENQKAVGIYTNGRFGRFVGNNIKANGCHSVGREKEQAHAFGFINEGLYSVIEANNIVGEWAGMSVGLENRGEYAMIEGNKILATHTICGRSIRSYANNSQITGNVLTSTSRNARLLEHAASGCIIGKNIMEVLMVQSECRSGCGIYAIGETCKDNIITENMIRNVVNCGIFADKTAGIISNNKVVSYPETVMQAGSENKYLLTVLNERRIQSIPE